MNDTVHIAVCGAHMSGLPLNEQLIELGGRLIEKTTTASNYRLYHLADFHPPRPGMVRVNHDGAMIALEVWALPVARYGAFVDMIPAPLGIGRVELANGRWVQGFVCEHYAIEKAQDITAYGGWRPYLAREKTR